MVNKIKESEYNIILYLILFLVCTTILLVDVFTWQDYKDFNPVGGLRFGLGVLSFLGLMIFFCEMLNECSKLWKYKMDNLK